MNLTKINGCYSKELRENCYNLKLLVKDKSTDTKTMINYVESIIEPAYINADAKKRFISNLRDCKTKEEVNELCGQVVIHGMYYKPTKRTK